MHRSRQLRGQQAITPQPDLLRTGFPLVQNRAALDSSIFFLTVKCGLYSAASAGLIARHERLLTALVGAVTCEVISPRLPKTLCPLQIYARYTMQNDGLEQGQETWDRARMQETATLALKNCAASRYCPTHTPPPHPTSSRLCRRAISACHEPSPSLPGRTSAATTRRLSSRSSPVL
jgi:hypothetical protein